MNGGCVSSAKRRGPIILISLLLAFLWVGEAAMESSCVCDDNEQQSEFLFHHLRSHRDVQFNHAEPGENNMGLSYRRPKGNSVIASSGKSSASKLSQQESHARTGACTSNQVHITLGEDVGSIVVSFASVDASTPSTVELFEDLNMLTASSYPSGLRQKKKTSRLITGTAASYSEIMYVSTFLTAPPMGDALASKEEVANLENTSTWAFDPVTKEHWYNYKVVTTPYTGLGQYNNPKMLYESPVIHTVAVGDLIPGKKYFYRVGGSCEVYQFTGPLTSTDPVDIYPYTLGLAADIGQTNVSVMTLDALRALSPDVILLPGDLSYSDGWPALWDSFGEIFQDLASRIPVLTTGGNHEIGSAESWLSYKERYPTPFRSSGSTNFCYWGKEIGPVHVVALCSYAKHEEGSLQWMWLQDYLGRAIDRSRTPWLVVMMHTPFYSSNGIHWMEGEPMRQSLEKYLYEAGVDLVIAGHVHAYERSHPVLDNVLNECAPTYITIGDGGNYEGPVTNWRMDELDLMWSAFRESSFGVGTVQFMNSSHAIYSWHRHACGSDVPGQQGMETNDENCTTPGDGSPQSMLTVDDFVFVRPPRDLCPNRYQSSATLSPGPPSSPLAPLQLSQWNLLSESFSNLAISSISLTTLLAGVAVLLAISNILLIHRVKSLS